MRFTTKTILTLIVVFLLSTNVAVVVAYQSHLNGEKNVKKATTIEFPDSQYGRFFRDQLNLDNDQNNSFRSFRQTYHRAANSVLTNMAEIRNQMLVELNNKKPNREHLDKLADQLGEKHKALKGITFDYYLNMQSVLNEIQQEKMVQIFQAMLTEEGYAKTPNHGEGHSEAPSNQEHRKGRNHNINGKGQHIEVNDSNFELTGEEEFLELEEEKE